jgi:SAM-dependent methyltransferase
MIYALVRQLLFCRFDWHHCRMTRDFERYLTDFKMLPFERIQEKYRLKRLVELLPKNLSSLSYVLEVGPGINPAFLHITGEATIDVLEPINELYIQNLALSKSMKKVKVWNQTAEKFIYESSEKKYDLVILSSVLHELESPKEVIVQIYNLLRSDGMLIIIVPNNQSVHRLISKEKNANVKLTELTSTEILMQQTSSFSPESLINLLNLVGFSRINVLTSFVKPLPHQGMTNAVNSGVIKSKDLDFLYDISSLLDGYGSEIFGVASK